MFKWLFWDGRHQLQGSCNLRRQDDQAAEQPARLGPLALQGEAPQLRLVVPDQVDIALHRLVERADGYLLGIQLHNPFHVRALMLRVYGPQKNRGETLIYQEVLERADLLTLPTADEHLSGGQPPAVSLPSLCDEAELATAPLRFALWVHHHPEGFARWQTQPSSADPVDQPGVLVGHRWSGQRQALPRACTRSLAEKPVAPDRSRQPYRVYNAASGDERAVRAALLRAAEHGAPFTEALCRFAKPLTAHPENATAVRMPC